MKKLSCFFLLIFTNPLFGSGIISIDSIPIQILPNPHNDPSLVNSVAFHPNSKLFCVTFSHNNSLLIYEFEESGKANLFQIMAGLNLQLNFPTHAIFSHDGNSLIVANHGNHCFNIYSRKKDGLYEKTPYSIVSFDPRLRPHGMKISPDGKYLAVTYCSYGKNQKAIELYKLHQLDEHELKLDLIDSAKGLDIDAAVPKGVTFSPDGTCLIVTFSRNSSIGLYELDKVNEKILTPAKQILIGPSTLVSRPEDIDFMIDGEHFAITNSDNHTITFYEYDKFTNVIPIQPPCHTLKNPGANLCFPHGLAFSPNGKFLVITQFGSAEINESKKTTFGKERKESISIFKIND